MKDEIKKYKEKELVVFSVNIEQKQHKNGTWKKELRFPKDWEKFTLEKSYYNSSYNGLSLLTGKINNIIVIDIDNVEHWKIFLGENGKDEPKTVKVKSGNGGIHLYFKYSDDLDEIKSKSKCFGQLYDIDVRTNGGCIIIPPTKYYSKNLNKEVEYIWEKNIFDNEVQKLPPWIKKLLLEKKIKKKVEKENKNNTQNIKIMEINDLHNAEISQDETELNFTIEDIETIVKMLSVNRCDNYNEWVNVGMCLYNLDQKYLLIWIKWSQQSGKYEDGTCDSKWKTFKKNKDGLKIGSLLLWAKMDNTMQYETFIKKKQLNKMIHSKYPNEKLILGDSIIVNDRCQYMPLKNRGCFIGGKEHENMPYSMYVDIIDKFMTIKCRYEECFGKTYPCQHILMNKNEMNIAFNGAVTININNNQDDELVEFQKINLFEDEELNVLVYKGMNGKSTPYAEILYYLNKSNYVYAENDCWYIYENHRWICLSKKNVQLRRSIQKELHNLYSKVQNYYIEHEGKQSKNVKIIKQIINNFDDTTLKNNIMIELGDIYSDNNNRERNFLQKLESNQYLIGFKNGIYDLSKFEFRDGKHNDYVTMSTNYNYSGEFSDNYQKLKKFLSDIQPNNDELDYLLTYISTGLFGNTLELFTVFTGTGRNGKSKLIELLEKTFGDYFGSIKSQLLTSQIKDGDAPAPGILDLLHKKIVVASETLEGTKLNTGFIKFLTGRDTATFRLCHQNDMVKFKAKFITFLACNDIPECDNMDMAFSKRLRCIHFPTEFVDNPNLPHQKKKDDGINIYFDDWKQDFMLLLIEYYKKYSESKKLIPTENILAWTSQYKESSDMYLNFLNECTEKSDFHIHTVVLYDHFKEWFKQNNPNTKIPGNKIFISGIRKHVTLEGVRVGDKTSTGIKNTSIIK
jgi:P4 family phage/plasmid primase-like protien